MDEPREMPRMCVEGDFLSIYECAECGAVVRDPDTHIGWHQRQWSEPAVINNFTCDCGRHKPCRHCAPINQRDFCDIPGCEREHSWTIPASAGEFVLCHGHMAAVAQVAVQQQQFILWEIKETSRG